jgi:hypothetical protein
MCASIKNPLEAWFNSWLVNSAGKEDTSLVSGKQDSDFTS